MQRALLKSARSTLSPGVVSPPIAALRDAAIKEMDAADPTCSEVSSLKFDVGDRNVTPLTYHDDDNGVAAFPGVFCPHIGNGSGGPR